MALPAARYAAPNLAKSILTAVSSRACIPLPPELAPDLDTDLTVLTDDEIMSMPASMFVHLKRTQAQDGLQVISPRQIPAAETVEKIAPTSMLPLMAMTGSDASPCSIWPTVDDDFTVGSTIVLDQPHVKSGGDLVRRDKTKVEPLRTEKLLDDNPAAKAVILARTIVDFQAREDVGGDPEAVAAAFDEVWKVPKDTIYDAAQLSMCADMDLARYAASSDTAFPMILEPVHKRRVIATVMGPGTHAAFGPYRRVDWAVFRTVAEARFMLTVENEGHSLKEMSLAPTTLVGTAQPTMGEFLCFQLAPATAWSCAPATFVIRDAGTAPPPVIYTTADPRLIAALRASVSRVSPINLAEIFKVEPQWSSRMVPPAATNTPNVFHGAMMKLAEAFVGAETIGKTAVRALKSLLAEAVQSTPIATQLKLTRTMRSVRLFMNMLEKGEGTEPSDKTIDSMATRLVMFNSHISGFMKQAAAHRGEEAERWFESIRTTLPTPATPHLISGMGWARMGMHHLLRSKEKQWIDLYTYLSTSAHEPAINFTEAFSATSAHPDTWRYARQVLMAAKDLWSETWFAAYDGEAVGALTCAREADERGMLEAADAFRAAHKLWSFLARFCRNLGAVLQSPEDIATRKRSKHAVVAANDLNNELDSMEWRREDVKHVAVVARPKDDYDAMTRGIKVGKGLASTHLAKHLPAKYTAGRVSDLFNKVLPYAPRGRAKGFLTHPSLKPLAVPGFMATKIEAILGECAADMTRAVIKAVEAAIVPVRSRAAAAPLTASAPAATFMLPDAVNIITDGYFWLTKMEVEDRAAMLDDLEKAGDNAPDMGEVFDTLDDFLEFVQGSTAEVAGGASGSGNVLK